MKKLRFVFLILICMCILVLNSGLVLAESSGGKFNKYLTTRIEFGEIYYTDMQNKTNTVQKVCLDGYKWFIYTAANDQSMLIQAFELEEGIVGGTAVPASCKSK